MGMDHADHIAETSRLSHLTTCLQGEGGTRPSDQAPQTKLPESWSSKESIDREIKGTIQGGLIAGCSPIWKIFNHIWEGEEEKTPGLLAELLDKHHRNLTPKGLSQALVMAALKKDKKAVWTIGYSIPRDESKVPIWNNAILSTVGFEGDGALEMLLDCREKIEGTDNSQPSMEHLRLACTHEDLRKLEILLKHGANPNGKTFCENAMKSIPLLLREINRNAPTTILSSLVDHGADTVLPDSEVRGSANRMSASLGTLEWMRTNKVGSVKTPDPITPEHWGQHLRRHLGFGSQGQEERLEEIKAIVTGWPTDLVRSVLEDAPSSPVADPDEKLRKLLQEEMVGRKKVVVGQTRCDSRGPALEF
jgi:hypothetical protein